MDTTRGVGWLSSTATSTQTLVTPRSAGAATADCLKIAFPPRPTSTTTGHSVTGRLIGVGAFSSSAYPARRYEVSPGPAVKTHGIASATTSRPLRTWSPRAGVRATASTAADRSAALRGAGGCGPWAAAGSKCGVAASPGRWVNANASTPIAPQTAATTMAERGCITGLHAPSVGPLVGATRWVIVPLLSALPQRGARGMRHTDARTGTRGIYVSFGWPPTCPRRRSP